MFALLSLGGVTGALFAIHRADQVVATEKTQQLLQVVLGQRHAGLTVGRLQYLLSLAQAPMAQQAHRRAAEFEVAPA